MRMSKKKKEGRRICKCDCGGTVHGVEDFDRVFSWCDTCTPVIKISLQDALKVSLKSLGPFPPIRRFPARR
jgi:hypothetical protein